MKDTGMASFKIKILFIGDQPISIVNCNQPLSPLETGTEMWLQLDYVVTKVQHKFCGIFG